MHEPQTNTDHEPPSGRPPQFGVKHMLVATAWIAAVLALVVAIINNFELSAVASLSVFIAVSLTVKVLLRWSWSRWLVWSTATFVVVLISLVVIAPIGPSKSASRIECLNNLKQIGIALQIYEDKYGSFPPACVADATGRPMHSWRVLILPFLDSPDAQHVYSQYRFDEPWDGPHNGQLHNVVMSLYRCPTDIAVHPLYHSWFPSDEHDDSGTETNYLAVVGSQTAWPDASSTKVSDFTDGRSTTIQVVEVADSGIHWMEPRDLPVLQMNPWINSHGGRGATKGHPGGAHVAFADGTVRFLIEGQTPPEVLRAILTRAGGEKLVETNDGLRLAAPPEH
jgi:prepilin-type processing-associated H-X9-DG protein